MTIITHPTIQNETHDRAHMSRFVKEFNDAEKLGSKNYATWKVRVNTIVDMCGLRERIQTGSTADTEEKQRNEGYMKYLILQNVKDDALVEIQALETAKEMWDHLEQSHQSNSLLNQLQLKRDLWHMQLRDDEEPIEFMKKFKLKIAEAATAGLAHDDLERSFIFLNALPPKYGAVALTLSATNAKIDLKKIESLLMNEYYRTQREDRTGANVVAAAAVQHTDTNHGKHKCKHCKKWGKHTEEECRMNPANRKNNPRVKFEDTDAARSDYKKRRTNAYSVVADHSSDDDDHEEYVNPFAAVARSPDPLQSENNTTTTWILDTGASNHICGDSTALTNIRSAPRICIATANGYVDVDMIGDLNVQFQNQRFTFSVYFSEKLTANLISLDRLSRLSEDIDINVRSSILTIRFRKTTVYESKSRKGIWLIDLTKPSLVAFAAEARTSILKPSRRAKVSHPKSADIDLWHRRLIHANLEDIRRLHHDGAQGIVINDIQSDWGIYMCDACIYAKHHAEGRKQASQSVTSRVLELVHSDLVGPLLKARNNEAVYVCTFIDDKSRYTRVYLLKNKEAKSVCDAMQEYMIYAERETGEKVLRLRIDGGSEYKNQMEALLRKTGIRIDKTDPERPHENGVAERYNRTLFEGVRAILTSQKLDQTLWADAVLYVCHIKNRLPHAYLLGISPYQAYYNCKPDLSNIRVFGCKVFAKKIGHLKKLDLRSRLGTFIGFQDGTKDWKILTEDTKRITTSKDCIFVEAPHYIPEGEYENHMLNVPWEDRTQNVKHHNDAQSNPMDTYHY